jgi:hypothetical protein
VLPAIGRPLHGYNFEQTTLWSSTVEDIRIDTIIADEDFPVATFPTGDFSVVFIVTGGEQRVPVSIAMRRQMLPLR